MTTKRRTWCDCLDQDTTFWVTVHRMKTKCALRCMRCGNIWPCSDRFASDYPDRLVSEYVWRQLLNTPYYHRRDGSIPFNEKKFAAIKNRKRKEHMVILDEIKMKHSSLKETLELAHKQMNVDALKAECAELEEQMSAPDFWNDVDNANKVSARVKSIQSKLGRLQKLDAQSADIETYMELVEETPEDEETFDELVDQIRDFEEKVGALRLEMLLKGPYDNSNAILSLHAGAGGTEAQDWTEMLYRMYTRYCESKGWKVTELDLLDGDDAGIKSVTFEVEGENAYGYLKAEKGVHRLVRISPFDASARRHTSFSSLDVTPIFDDDTGDIKIEPEDIRVDTYRSGGAGGQNVNKVSSAIRITHLATGIVVQCQNERSQLQNKEMAMRMLRGKLLELQEREREEQMASIKGEMKKIEWGSQIRSYVFQPYTLVKDHRTGEENGNIQSVMDGNLDNFISAYLTMS